MEKYVTPRIIKYKDVDNLLRKNKSHTLFDSEEKNLSISNLVLEEFVCIVGEPGIGKTRLVNEIKKYISEEKTFICKASEFSLVHKETEYCIIDALDEVEGSVFYNTLQSIKQYKEEHHETKVLFTCRKHYVTSYAKHFTSCKDLLYVEICRLKEEEVIRILDNHCTEKIKENVSKSPKLRELLTIPRYLEFLLEYKNFTDDISNISELFELIIKNSIQKAIEKRKENTNSENIKILIQRVLEKVAFIMEISRKDQISKDELYTILDGVKGNMAQMLIANFDILFFESRILKDTNGILQFENTELQEYLAAKELCRQDNMESVLYDVAVQKELKHVYPNWYDVIPHISDMGNRGSSFVNVIKLIVSYESSLENESFASLLRYVDSSLLSIRQKEDLFTVVFEHYLHVPTYISWKSQILKLMQDCYTSRCDNLLILLFEKLNNIQLANICAILEVIVEEDKLNEEVSKYWTSAANTLFREKDEEKKLAGLNLYNALNNKDELIQLAKNYNSYSKIVKEKYCEITGYGLFTCTDVVNCWLENCYVNNPYAINAVLHIEDPSTIVYAYNKIIENNKLQEFFNKEGSLVVCYELCLKKQFDIVWSKDIKSKLLITKVIASFIENHSYVHYSHIDIVIKQILLEKEIGEAFIGYFDSEWDLENIFSHLNDKLVDIELLSTLENLLYKLNKENWYVDNILMTLTNKIRKDEVKIASISKYITRYAETFNRWDNSSSEETKVIMENLQLVKTYQSLSDPNVPMDTKYEIAFKLSKHIEFIKQHQNTQPLVDVIKTFFDGINLDEMILEKTGENSYSLSLELIKIPSFINLMINLDCGELVKEYRFILAKTLPIVCCTSTNLEANEISNSYKLIIGTFNENEKDELMAWWKSRKDDFLNISFRSIFMCITEYGIKTFSYKLEEYIDDYKKHQNFNHQISASGALELISEGYLNWNIEQYRKLFEALEDDSIESLKMQCNAIMIEKFQDFGAITWRIEYLKNNIVKSLHNDTGHVRPISIAESEMISSNPKMFRCFMNIKGNDKLIEHMFDLFDFALSICVKPDTQEYSSYLLRQIYFFFVNTNDTDTFILLRKKVEKFNASNASYLANSIMNNAEIIFLRKEEKSINKSIKLYNKCVEKSHLDIRNNGDFIRYFKQVQFEVQREIQDQGIYSLVRQETLSEDFIQRELKNTIINKCCQMGLEAIQIDREVTLQDNKRTDLLIRYGMCNPIMIELKLLHNNEIQNDKQRIKYKAKFIQYTNATKACLSVFWVFDVHRRGCNKAKFEALKIEYQDFKNTMVLFTDCKCSSGFETGVSSNNKTKKKMLNSKKKSS